MKKKLVIILCILFTIGCKKTDVAKVTPPPVAEVKVPKVLTNDITGLTFYSVVFGGKILDSAGEKITEYGFVVDTVTAPTTVKNFKQVPITIRNNDGSFILNVGDLPSSVTYYLRAYAINANGTGYGNEVKFTTKNQKIYEGNVNLATQQEVIDFGSNGYTMINGALNISGSVTDLTPLLGLAIINAGFTMTGAQVVNFKGLDSLEITGAIFPNNFFVERNPLLTSFKGLAKLRITRGIFQINKNSSLVNFEGLDSYVAASAGQMGIYENEKLQNLNGLKHFEFVGSDFYISNNPSLTDISGLANLSQVYGRIYIINNAMLPNLHGLEKITNLEGGIEIDNNPVLNNLDGIQNLATASSSAGRGAINIDGNPMIADLSVFKNIVAVDYMNIKNNSGLKDLSGLKNLEKINQVLHIENNPLLKDLSGLEKLSSIARLEIFDNDGLVNLHGISSITKIAGNGSSLLIWNNDNLTSLTGIEHLVTADGSVQITLNKSLTDFCALKPLFNNGYNNFFFNANNAVNPTQDEILANCQ